MSEHPTLGTAAHPHTLARVIGRAAATLRGTVTRTYGQILSTQAGPPRTVTVSIAGDPTPVAGVSFVSSYAPTVGDTVAIDFLGNDPVVVYTLAGSTFPTIVRVFPFSVTTDASGIATVTWPTPFANTISAVVAGVDGSSGFGNCTVDVTAKTLTGCTLHVYNANSNANLASTTLPVSIAVEGT